MSVSRLISNHAAYDERLERVRLGKVRKVSRVFTIWVPISTARREGGITEKKALVLLIMLFLLCQRLSIDRFGDPCRFDLCSSRSTV